MHLSNIKSVLVALLDNSKECREMFLEYLSIKKIYKWEIKLAKKIYREKEMEEVKNIKNINDAWKFIKRRQPAPTQSPPAQETEDHFRRLLSVRNEAEPSLTTSACTEEGPEITKEELEGALNSLKNGKAAGPDEIQAEAFKWADTKMIEALRSILNSCLNGGEIPEEWQEGRIVPIYKKGDPAEAANYRGITICNAAYRIYASILNTRLQDYVEENQLLQDTQNGFRRGRGVMDNVYILSRVITDTLQKGQQLFTAFIDFKAAFDTISRTKLLE